MNVRKVKIDSIADLDAIPEDEWVVAPDGINVPFDYEHFHVEGRAVLIRLPSSVLKELRPRRGRRLRALISKREFVVEEVRQVTQRDCGDAPRGGPACDQLDPP